MSLARTSRLDPVDESHLRQERQGRGLLGVGEGRLPVLRPMFLAEPGSHHEVDESDVVFDPVVTRPQNVEQHP
jgi:hypothetical protein